MDDVLAALRQAVAVRGGSVPRSIEATERETDTPEPDEKSGESEANTDAQIALFADVAPERSPAASEASSRSAEPKPSRRKSSPERRASGSAEAAPVASRPVNADVVKGHRERLRARFNRGEAFEDYELLELLLFRSNARSDTKPTAKALIARFGSFARAVGAPADQLLAVDGVGAATVTDFRLVRATAERFAREALSKGPVLSSTDAVVDYYRTCLRTAAVEEFHVLFVDKRNQFMASECLGRGTVDHTPVYPRELMKRALEHGASAIVLVHNHPSGDPTPSRADVAMTLQICAAARPLGIAVHDHLIIGANDYTSLRVSGLLNEE